MAYWARRYRRRERGTHEPAAQGRGAVVTRTPLTVIPLLLLCAAAGACGGAAPGGAPAPAADATTPSAPEDLQAVRDADQTFVGSIENRNATAIERVLDPEFTWLTPAGVLRSRASIVASIPDAVVMLSGVPTADARPYGGNVMVVQRHSVGTHRMHVWVRRDASWRLLHVSEVIEREYVPYGGTMIGAAGCINPCQTVPFLSATPEEKSVMDAWQAQQSGPEAWARHVAEENVARTTNGTHTKAERLAVQRQQSRDRVVVTPSPLAWARIWEFGEAAFMLTLQSRAGERPFWASRVFERREGVWMMAESYQVTIEAMPPF